MNCGTTSTNSEIKMIAEQERNREYQRLWRARNRERYLAISRRHYANNREKRLEESKVSNKLRRLRVPSWIRYASKYGVTKEFMRGLFQKQNGLCAICGLDKPLWVDHNHDTGRVRGLLRRGCNTMVLGVLENKKLVEKAIAYLKVSQQ